MRNGLRLQRQLASHKLLIVDQLGHVPLSQTGAELLFEVFSQRYERGATIVPLRTLSARCCCIAANDVALRRISPPQRQS